AGGRELAVERAVAAGITRHVVEQDCRRGAATFFGKHVGNRAHLDVPVGPVDLAQFSHLFDLLEPAAQPAILHSLFGTRLAAGARHAVLPNPRVTVPRPQGRALAAIVYSRILL